MMVCAHFSFSQRATWPPSAAVRQLSIADITLSWSRLTWLGVAPCRTMAAEDIRDLQRRTAHGRRSLRRRPDFPALAGLLASLRQQIERARDARDHASGDTRVVRRRIQFVVTQERLDDSNVGAALEQVGGEAVS